MTRMAFVNGQFRWLHQAQIPLLDRGYYFADGLYEVMCFFKGQVIAFPDHWARLLHSLRSLQIEWMVDPSVLFQKIKQLFRLNRRRDGFVYIQITRGVAPRDHAFPQGVTPSWVMMVLDRRINLNPTVEQPAKVITVPDLRWGRCDIKSISLLPNILAKQNAKEHHANEAWQVTLDGFITEGTASNAWIVIGNQIITHPLSPMILGGVTRTQLLRIIEKQAGLALVERPFHQDEILNADEAFLTSTTQHVMPVVQVNEHKIGDHHPGPITRGLRQAFIHDVLLSV